LHTAGINVSSAFTICLTIVKLKKGKMMHIGIVSTWLNRGQATVSRYLRSILDELGHKTFVLARPTRDNDALPKFIAKSDVWEQEGVAHASNFVIPLKEYKEWAVHNSLDLIFFDSNLQFKEIAALRAMGIKTIGRFIWESFGIQHLTGYKKIPLKPFMWKMAGRCLLSNSGIRPMKGAIDAYDIIYSLNKCECTRYADFGVDSPWVPWGCHPELLNSVSKKRGDAIYFYFPGGFQGGRKPIRKTVKAFTQVQNPNIRLIIKAQGERSNTEHIDDFTDKRIIHIKEDLSAKEYYDLFSSCHVCLAPSRWEGLGQHFYEAVSFGLPTITNNIPPHNEVIQDRYNGILVKSHKTGYTASGIPYFDPDVEDLTRAIAELSDPETVEAYARNTVASQKIFSWENTIKHAKDAFGL